MSEPMCLTAMLGAALLMLAADGLFFSWLYFRIRARGYRSPLVGLGVAVLPLGSFSFPARRTRTFSARTVVFPWRRAVRRSSAPMRS